MIDAVDTTDAGALHDAESMTRSMLAQIVRPLVDFPERCCVTVVPRGGFSTFVVEVLPRDMEKFTGRNMRTARSLQVIVDAIGMKAERRFSLIFEAIGGHTEAGKEQHTEAAGT